MRIGEKKMISFDIAGSGEALLLLHGALVSRTMWEPQIQEFSRYYRVVSCDLPAHGETADISGEYSISRLCESLIQLLGSLGIEDTHIVGHSLGGMVAQQLAVSYTERVQKLVLAETAFGTKNSTWERVQSSFASSFLNLTPQNILVELSVRQYGSLNAQVSEFLRGEMVRFDQKTSVRVMGAAMHFAGKEQLRNIHSPTLVLVAQMNKRTHEQGRDMARLIPAARFEIIPKAHHMLNMDNPDAFNQVVLTFLGDEG
jgi:pimeloyl-ACP methyl ester carboxylesterase